MPNNRKSEVQDAKKDRNISKTIHDQLDIAQADGKMSKPRVHFSTWLIDTFAHGNNTQGLLIVFPFEVSKADEKRERFEEMIQDAFREIYLT